MMVTVTELQMNIVGRRTRLRDHTLSLRLPLCPPATCPACSLLCHLCQDLRVYSILPQQVSRFIIFNSHFWTYECLFLAIISVSRHKLLFIHAHIFIFIYFPIFCLDSTPSPQHEKDPSSSLLAQMHMQASKYGGGGVAGPDTKHPHALQFPPPMQYMGMTHMSHLSPWQLAAH